MLFQLINQNIQWYQFLLNAILTIVGRSLDLISTRYVSKELKLETNKIAQRIGWKGMLLMQIPIIILGTLDFYFSFFILWSSLFLFANNIEGSWYIKEAGEDNYYIELKARTKNASIKKIIFSEFSYIIKFTTAGVFIIIFLFLYRDLLAVFLIALALVVQGIFGTISSLLYLLRMKKEKSEE